MTIIRFEFSKKLSSELKTQEGILPGGPSKKRNVMTPSLDMRYPEQHFNDQLPASIPCTKHEH